VNAFAPLFLFLLSKVSLLREADRPAASQQAFFLSFQAPFVSAFAPAPFVEESGLL
jgi:hypothetical protein